MVHYCRWRASDAIGRWRWRRQQRFRCDRRLVSDWRHLPRVAVERVSADESSEGPRRHATPAMSSVNSADNSPSIFTFVLYWLAVFTYFSWKVILTKNYRALDRLMQHTHTHTHTGGSRLPNWGQPSPSFPSSALPFPCPPLPLRSRPLKYS